MLTCSASISEACSQSTYPLSYLLFYFSSPLPAAIWVSRLPRCLIQLTLTNLVRYSFWSSDRFKILTCLIILIQSLNFIYFWIRAHWIITILNFFNTVCFIIGSVFSWAFVTGSEWVNAILSHHNYAKGTNICWDQLLFYQLLHYCACILKLVISSFHSRYISFSIKLKNMY